MAEERQKVVVRCTVCAHFVLNGDFEGSTEVLCSNSRCGATLFVSLKDGAVTIKAVPKKARPTTTTT